MAAPKNRQIPERVLLVAQSARLLAQSCTRAGLRAMAADLFADEDTRESTERCLAVPSRGHGFVDNDLLEAADELAPPGGNTGLIYGSGIDTRPDLLEKLMQGRVLLGNAPDVLRIIKTPRRFFRLLDQLRIPYPDTLLTPPESPGPWLVKRGGSEGGMGVRYWPDHYPGPVDDDDYYQLFLPGQAMSALFIANGTSARIIGFNTLWTSHHSPSQPWLFAGAINRAALNDDQRHLVAGYASTITRAVGLVGLNGIDFMCDGDSIRVLEVNPRPSATLQLYDADQPGGWLREHIAACRGSALATASPGPVRAFRVTYATQTTFIPLGFPWPEGCFDRPIPDSRIEPGRPLCTVSCKADTFHGAEAGVLARAAEILRLVAVHQRKDQSVNTS